MFTDICAGDGPGELCSFVASRLIEPHSWLEHTGFDPRGRTPRVHISCPSSHRASPDGGQTPSIPLRSLALLDQAPVSPASGACEGGATDHGAEPEVRRRHRRRPSRRSRHSSASASSARQGRHVRPVSANRGLRMPTCRQCSQSSHMCRLRAVR
jgi:hypothetical protein